MADTGGTLMYSLRTTALSRTVTLCIISFAAWEINDSYTMLDDTDPSLLKKQTESNRILQIYAVVTRGVSFKVADYALIALFFSLSLFSSSCFSSFFNTKKKKKKKY